MAYTVEHVRFIFECDACGLIEKHDRDADPGDGPIMATAGWSRATLNTHSFLCCPNCDREVRAVLFKRAKQANCVHEFSQRGLVAQCVKCLKWDR